MPTTRITRLGQDEVAEYIDLRPVRSHARFKAIAEAISNIDLRMTEAWDDISDLDGDFRVEAIEAVPEGIFEIGRSKRFAAIATAYVRQEFSGPGEMSVTEALPAEVRGHFDEGGKAVIDKLKVDTVSLSD